ncbi:hypothetical protein CEXT_138731 [Caerostris extrusa]|uniref:Uncharacterized protein n=1 Tax=Caerostris extrusa TaxID=172846 RepID=A0AAV4R5C8_CAEEX|nr:hypothetical protein CEXT_138731 [Caerostris extrusa]
MNSIPAICTIPPLNMMSAAKRHMLPPVPIIVLVQKYMARLKGLLSGLRACKILLDCIVKGWIGVEGNSLVPIPPPTFLVAANGQSLPDERCFRRNRVAVKSYQGGKGFGKCIDRPKSIPLVHLRPWDGKEIHLKCISLIPKPQEVRCAVTDVYPMDLVKAIVALRPRDSYKGSTFRSRLLEGFASGYRFCFHSRDILCAHDKRRTLRNSGH